MPQRKIDFETVKYIKQIKEKISACLYGKQDLYFEYTDTKHHLESLKQVSLLDKNVSNNEELSTILISNETLDNIGDLYGHIKSIIHDRNSQFLSEKRLESFLVSLNEVIRKSENNLKTSKIINFMEYKDKVQGVKSNSSLKKSV